LLVLAVESATDAAAVALADEDGALGSVVVARGRRHTETIAPAIDALCRRLSVSLSDVDLVGIDVGPGLFTGLRVGVGTAQALALALGVGVVTATSLEVLAQAMVGSGATEYRTVVSVVDARRGEVFSNRFAAAREGVDAFVALGDDAVWAPEALAADLEAHRSAGGGPLVLAGDGALRYRHLFAGLPDVTLAGTMMKSPPVVALAELCVARGTAGLVGDGASVVPRYLRQADATINWKTRIAPRAPAPRP
jgi:tRNA threonylcarbamoyladenosine biosynthesis protein TsaB